MRNIEYDSILYVIGVLLVLVGAFLKVKGVDIADYFLGGGIILNAVVFFAMVIFAKPDTDADGDGD